MSCSSRRRRAAGRWSRDAAVARGAGQFGGGPAGSRWGGFLRGPAGVGRRDPPAWACRSRRTACRPTGRAGVDVRLRVRFLLPAAPEPPFVRWQEGTSTVRLPPPAVPPARRRPRPTPPRRPGPAVRPAGGCGPWRRGPRRPRRPRPRRWPCGTTRGTRAGSGSAGRADRRGTAGAQPIAAGVPAGAASGDAGVLAAGRPPRRVAGPGEPVPRPSPAGLFPLATELLFLGGWGPAGERLAELEMTGAKPSPNTNPKRERGPFARRAPARRVPR